MKTLKLFLFAATIFTLSACSSDDDNPGPVVIELTNGNVAGTYEIIYYAGTAETSATAQGQTVVIETETYSGDTFTDARVMLDVDGMYTISGSYVETYTVTVTGQPPVTDEDVVILDDTGSFSVNNAERTITLDGEEFDVTFFDGTNLNITGSYSETFQGFTDTENYEYRLVKI